MPEPPNQPNAKVNKPGDDITRRAPLARAQQLLSQVLTASIGMIVPGLLGNWLDKRFGILPWLTIAGFAFGLWYGFMRLIQIAQPASRNSKDK